MPDAPLLQRIREAYIQYFAYWAWLVVVAVLMVGGITIIYPTWQYIQSTGAFGYLQLLETQKAKESELSQLKIMHEQLLSLNQSQLLYLEDTLPDATTPPQLMEQVSRSLASQGYFIQSIDVVDAKAKTVTGTTAPGASTSASATSTTQDIPGVKEVLLTVSIAGDASYEGLKEFLRVVSSSNPILELYSVSYSTERESFSIVLTTYVAE